MAPDLNNIPVRDADKTRVYSADETRTRAADETSVIAQSSSERDVSIGNTLAYERAQKPGLFDGLSLAQIIAGAAAAAPLPPFSFSCMDSSILAMTSSE